MREKRAAVVCLALVLLANIAFAQDHAAPPPLVIDHGLQGAPPAGAGPVLVSPQPTPAPTPPPPVANASLVTPKTEVGATGDLLLDVPKDIDAKKVEVAFPGDAVPVFTQNGAATLDHGKWRVPVRLLVAGKHQIASLDVKGTDAEGNAVAWITSPITLEVAAPEHSPDQPKNFTSIFRAPTNWGRISLLGIAGLLLLALLSGAVAWLIWRWKHRPAAPAAPAPPPLPPIEEARTAFARIQSLELYRSHGSKAHYAEWSTILRRYFERSQSIPALEWTEDELSAFVREKMAERHAATGLLASLANAAMAKFAKWDAPEPVVRADLSAATAFLDSEVERERIAKAFAEARGKSTQEAA